MYLSEAPPLDSGLEDAEDDQIEAEEDAELTTKRSHNNRHVSAAALKEQFALQQMRSCSRALHLTFRFGCHRLFVFLSAHVSGLPARYPGAHHAQRAAQLSARISKF